MSLILRLLLVVLAAPFRRRLGIGERSHVRMWVLPNDLDVNLHMNNGRYNTIIDLAHIDLILRSGLANTLVKNKWRPLIGSTLIRHRFGLRPFEGFVVSSRVLCWDDKWLYFENLVTSRRGVAAVALTKGVVRHGAGTVSPATLLEAAGFRLQSPPTPVAIARWLSVEEALHID